MTNEALTDTYNQNAAARSLINPEPIYGDDFRFLPVPAKWDGKVKAWEYVKRAWDGGMGRIHSPLSNRYIWSNGVDASHPGYLVLSQLWTSAATPDPTGTLSGIHWEFVFGALIAGIGSGTDLALNKETSATSPVIAVIAYNPSGTDQITGTGAVILDGTATSRRLIVGLATSAAQVVGLDGTVAATMHAGTAGLTWILQTSLPDPAGNGFIVLLGITTTIGYLTTESASTAAPTTVQADIPSWHQLIKPGEFSIAGGPHGGISRAWILIGNDNDNNHPFNFSAEEKSQIYSVALDGTDLRRFPSTEMPHGVIQAVPITAPNYGPSIVYTDGERVALHNGDVEVNLKIFNDMTVVLNAVSAVASVDNLAVRCRGFATQGNDLYAVVQLVDIESLTANTQMALWKYDWQAAAWHNMTAWLVLADDLVQGVLTGGSHAVSPNTRYFHMYAQGQWRRVYLLPPGEIPFPEAGMQTGVARLFATTGYILSPFMTLPQSAGLPSMVESIEVMGSLSKSGTAANVIVQVGRNTAYGQPALTGFWGTTTNVTFGDDAAAYQDGAPQAFRNYMRNANNEDWFYEFWTKITLNQGATADETPLVTQVIYRGLTFLDGIVRTPKEVWGE